MSIGSSFDSLSALNERADEEWGDEFDEPDPVVSSPQEGAEFGSTGAEEITVTESDPDDDFEEDEDDDFEEDEEEVVYEDEDGNPVDPSDGDYEVIEEDDEEPVDRFPATGGVSPGELSMVPTTDGSRLESNDTGLAETLNIDSSSFSLTRKRVLLDDIVVSSPKKKSRAKTYRGLTQSVKELGVLNPIHVMVTESYSGWLDSGEEGIFTGGNKYLLLDGFRRIFASYRNRIEEVEAIIWRFKNPEYGRDIANVVALVLNKSQDRQWDELWGLMQVLESEAAMSPGVLEYLLELDSGDSVKLKDIAMADNYPEVWEELVEGKKSLQQATSMLAKLRKEEDKSLLEDGSGLASYEDAEGIVGDSSEGGQITEEDAKELLEIDGSSELNFSEMEDEEFLGEEAGDLQSTSERKPLDPVLRGKILARDGYACQVCFGGKGLTSSLFVMGAQIHHTVGVYNQLEGSRDDTGMIFEESEIPKLLTTCATDHSLIHLCAGRDGKLGISKEEFDALPEHEQERWRNIAKYAKVLLWAEKKSGKSLKKSQNFKLDNTPFWESEKDNTEAIQLAQMVESGGRDYDSPASDEDGEE